jgi:hypothetical protein
MKKIIIVLAVLAGGIAHAENGCRAVATMDTPAIEDPTSIMHKGDILDNANVFQTDKNGSPTAYASPGGYSYPAANFKLLNCHVAKIALPYPETGYGYDLVLNNTASNANQIIEQSVFNQLVSAGVDEADAGNAADAYIHNPDTACGQAAKMILNGHTELVNGLSSICQNQ